MGLFFDSLPQSGKGSLYDTSDDTPIEKPEDDLFGVDRFSKSIATTFLQQKSPEGTVIAINGPWGAGKSSIVNLIRHHLSEAEKAAEIKVVDFKCWWFQGEEALILAFFQALYEGMKDKKGSIKLGSVDVHLI